MPSWRRQSPLLRDRCLKISLVLTLLVWLESLDEEMDTHLAHRNQRFYLRLLSLKGLKLEIKLLKTADIFAIELCSYAVMSNQVVRIWPDLAQSWTELDVVKCWQQCFNGTLFSQRFLSGDPLSRLNVNLEVWKALTTEFESHIQCWVGGEHIVRRVCEGLGYKRQPSKRQHERLFNSF